MAYLKKERVKSKEKSIFKTEIVLADIPKSEHAFFNNYVYIYKPQIFPSTKQLIYQERDTRKLAQNIIERENIENERLEQIKLREKLKRFRNIADDSKNEHQNIVKSMLNLNNTIPLNNLNLTLLNNNTNTIKPDEKVGKVEKVDLIRFDNYNDMKGDANYLENDNETICETEVAEYENQKSCCERFIEWVYGSIFKSQSEHEHIWIGNTNEAFNSNFLDTREFPKEKVD